MDCTLQNKIPILSALPILHSCLALISLVVGSLNLPALPIYLLFLLQASGLQPQRTHDLWSDCRGLSTRLFLDPSKSRCLLQRRHRLPKGRYFTSLPLPQVWSWGVHLYICTFIMFNVVNMYAGWQIIPWSPDPPPPTYLLRKKKTYIQIRKWKKWKK